jgi:hypothetical protein
MSRATLVVLAACVASACSSPPSSADAPLKPGRADARSSAPAAARPASSATATEAPHDPPSPPSVAEGAWEGSFEAKKGSVAVPDGVNDKARAGDDGASAIGAGKVALKVTREGDVRGTMTGALGAASVTGRVDVDIDGHRTVLRATVLPDDPMSKGAMTGVLVADLKGGAFVGEIKVAGPDARVVREAAIELKKR